MMIQSFIARIEELLPEGVRFEKIYCSRRGYNTVIAKDADGRERRYDATYDSESDSVSIEEF